MSLITELEGCEIKENQIALIWLGQAGFIAANSKGNKVVIDPYLSHCGERLKNFIRMSPILIKAEELSVDAYLVSHKHFDHFDYDSIPLAAANTNAHFFGPVSCVREFETLQTLGKTMELLEIGKPEIQVADGISVKAVYADHGEMEPDAIGMLMNIGGMKIYVTGDTAYRPDEMEAVRNSKPDIMLASINGEFGNLTPETGAKLAVYTGAKCLVPCHFWTFREHKGRPDLLEAALEAEGSGAKAQFLTPGSIYICEKGENGDISFRRTEAGVA